MKASVMFHSTPASKKRQQSSVNSRLDFDASQAAANLVAAQRGHAAIRPLGDAQQAARAGALGAAACALRRGSRVIDG